MFEQAMRAYYAAYNAEDPARLADLLDEQVVLCSAVGEQRGREAYIATYRYMIENFIDAMEPIEIVALDDGARVRISDRLIARHDIADFMGRRMAKGEEMTLDLVGHYRFRNGRIVAISIAPAT